MNNISLMQQALGNQWHQLPSALKTHYQYTDNIDKGTLSIEYPKIMQPYLNLLRLMGALMNRHGKTVPTEVRKVTKGNIQYWNRTILYPDNKIMLFKSHWVYAKNNEFIEYVNSFLGLRMTVSVINKQLHYNGKHFVLRLGKWLLPIPEWLVLGHTTIVETAIDESSFIMDFRLTHPIFGQVFRYSGKFRTI